MLLKSSGSLLLVVCLDFEVHCVLFSAFLCASGSWWHGLASTDLSSSLLLFRMGQRNSQGQLEDGNTFLYRLAFIAIVRQQFIVSSLCFLSLGGSLNLIPNFTNHPFTKPSLRTTLSTYLCPGGLYPIEAAMTDFLKHIWQNCIFELCQNLKNMFLIDRGHW